MHPFAMLKARRSRFYQKYPKLSKRRLQWSEKLQRGLKFGTGVGQKS